MISRVRLFPLLALCAAGCTNSAPTSTEPVAPSPAAIVRNEEIKGTVVMTRQGDLGVDGTIDDTYVRKTSYDRRGNAVLVEEEHTQPGLTRRWVTRSSYDRWGNVFAQVVEHQGGPSNTRLWLSTVETDDAGRPSRQVYLLDYDQDGAPDHEGNMVYYPTYDPYGRPLQKITDADNDVDGALETRSTETMAYDNNGNVEKHTLHSDWGMDGSIESSYWSKVTYNEHGTAVHGVSESFELNNGTSRASTTTSQLDNAGNPIVQATNVDYSPADDIVDAQHIMTTSYDEHHRPLNQVTDTDIGADGTVERRDSTTYVYLGTVARSSGRFEVTAAASLSF